jgi:hypothetical protein
LSATENKVLESNGANDNGMKESDRLEGTTIVNMKRGIDTKTQELDTVRAWENEEEIGAVNYILIGNIG